MGIDNDANTTGKDITVDFDVEAVMKAVREEIKKSLKGNEDAAAIEAVCATIEKSATDIHNGLSASIEKAVKEMEERRTAIEEEAIKKAAIKDGVKQDEIYKCMDGSTISKGVVGEAAFSIVKSMDTQIAKMQEGIIFNECLARVEKEFTGVTGELTKKALLLKEAKQSLSPSSFETFETILKSVQSLTDKVTVEKGCGTGTTKRKEDTAYGSEDDAALDALAKEYATKNNMSVAKAYGEVIKTEEGLKLYNSTRIR